MSLKSDTTVTIRMNKNVKQQAQHIFSDLGMDMSTAINVFLRQTIYRKGFPFDLKLDIPNETTRRAIDESDQMLRQPHAKRFSSVEELFADLDAE